MQKPKYRVPTMQKIKEIPWNGYNVVSTFSGGGGSCLGYRMAGFRVLYANEFVEEAQKTYRANHDAFLDTRDIREVTAESILDIVKLQKGEIDLFDGSPPCCAFSTAGRREKGWGKERDYSDGKKQRIEDLFFEYIRLLDGLQPKTFIAENVSGLVKGKAVGYFNDILSYMKQCGYKVKAALIDASWLGVPQRRERVIFCGVRKDIAEKYVVRPTFPNKLPYYYTLKDAFENITNDKVEEAFLLQAIKKYKIYQILKRIPKNPLRVISGDMITGKGYFNLCRESMFQPSSTICQSHGGQSVAGVCHPLYDRKFTIAELKRITSIPDDFILTGTYEQQWERLGRMVPPVMMSHIAKTVEKEILCKIRS